MLKKAQEVDRQKPNPKVTAETAGAEANRSALLVCSDTIDGFHDEFHGHRRRSPEGERCRGPGSQRGRQPVPRRPQVCGWGHGHPEQALPEFATAGPTRIWREEETQGESYIPHADDWRRPRAVSILEQTANLFGLTVQKRFADGAVVMGDELRRAMRFADGAYVASTRSRPSGSGMNRMSFPNSLNLTGKVYFEDFGWAQIEAVATDVYLGESAEDQRWQRTRAGQ